MIKYKPHHDLAGIKAKFAVPETLELTSTAFRNAAAIGYGLAEIVEVVRQLQTSDFHKSETAHTPPNSRVWHDTYLAPFDGMTLYLKFAGETLIDVTLVSFKEATS